MLISLKNVKRIYKNGTENLYALNNINLNISENEFIGIIGPSGCGKSTLLNLIGMIDNAYSGEYYFNDVLVNNMKSKNLAQFRNNYLGFIFQYFGLINTISIHKNVKLPLEYCKIKNSEIENRVTNILTQLDIIDKKDMYPSQLSGGQCQKVSIARALINNPKIILADEPTGALDKKNGDRIMEILKDLHKKGKTIILVTHDLNLTKFCSRVIEMEDGKILYDNNISDFCINK